jgi:hypothetical protein
MREGKWEKKKQTEWEAEGGENEYEIELEQKRCQENGVEGDGEMEEGAGDAWRK